MIDTYFTTLATKLQGRLHNIARFGHSNDIALLASANDKERWNYLNGVISFIAFILILISIWALLLLFFRWRGPRKWGCAAGQFVDRVRVEDEGEEIQPVQPKRKVLYCLVEKIVQIFFVCSCIIVLVMPIVLIRSALPKLDFAALQTVDLNEDILNILYEGDALASSGATIEQKLNNTNFTTINIRSYCGSQFNESAFLAALTTSAKDNVTVSEFFYSTTNASALSNDTITNHIASSFGTVQEYLSRFEIAEVRKNLLVAVDKLHSLNDALHRVLDGEWAVKLYGCFLIAIVAALIVVALMHLFTRTARPVRPFLYWFLLPVFIIFVIFSWAISMLISAAAIMNSDFCFGGPMKTPESAVLAMMKQRGIQENGLLYKSFLYYQSSCTLPTPFDFISNYGQNISNGISAINVVLTSSAAKNSTDMMTTACGKNISPWLSDVQVVTSDMNALLKNLQESLQMTTCATIQPLFNRTFDGAICQENIDGLSISSVTLLSIAVFGMVMLTVRSALYSRETSVNEENDSLKHEGSPPPRVPLVAPELYNQTSRQRTEDISSENAKSETNRTDTQERHECNNDDIEVSLDADSNNIGEIRQDNTETSNHDQPRKTMKGMRPLLF